MGAEVGNEGARAVGVVHLVVQAGQGDAVGALFGLLGEVGDGVSEFSAVALLVGVGKTEFQLLPRVHAPKQRQARGCGVELGEFRKTVPVVVVGLAIALVQKERNAQVLPGHHQRAVARELLLPRLPAHVPHGLTQTELALLRNARHHIHRAPNGARPVQGRPRAAHHFNAVHERCGNLLQAIQPGQGREQRPAVDQNLAVPATQAVDAQLGVVAGLAVGFHAQAGLEVQAFAQITALGAFQGLGADDAHHHRCIRAALKGARAGDHGLFQLKRIGLQIGFHRGCRRLRAQDHMLDGRQVTHIAHHHAVGAPRKATGGGGAVHIGGEHAVCFGHFNGGKRHLLAFGGDGEVHHAVIPVLT